MSSVVLSQPLGHLNGHEVDDSLTGYCACRWWGTRASCLTGRHQIGRSSYLVTVFYFGGADLGLSASTLLGEMSAVECPQKPKSNLVPSSLPYRVVVFEGSVEGHCLALACLFPPVPEYHQTGESKAVRPGAQY